MKHAALLVALCVAAAQSVAAADCCCVIVCKHRDQACSDCGHQTAPKPVKPFDPGLPARAQGTDDC
jgi:hypothetical protein